MSGWVLSWVTQSVFFENLQTEIRGLSSGWCCLRGSEEDEDASENGF